MTDDQLSATLAEIRERQAKAAAREGDTAVWLGAAMISATEDVPRLLAAVDAVLALHTPVFRIIPSAPCDAHLDADTQPVPGCKACQPQQSREVCLECRDQFGDPVLFTDCRVRAAILAALTGEREGNAAGR